MFSIGIDLLREDLFWPSNLELLWIFGFRCWMASTARSGHSIFARNWRTGLRNCFAPKCSISSRCSEAWTAWQQVVESNLPVITKWKHRVQVELTCVIFLKTTIWSWNFLSSINSVTDLSLLLMRTLSSKSSSLLSMRISSHTLLKLMLLVIRYMATIVNSLGKREFLDKNTSLNCRSKKFRVSWIRTWRSHWTRSRQPVFCMRSYSSIGQYSCLSVNRYRPSTSGWHGLFVDTWAWELSSVTEHCRLVCSTQIFQTRCFPGFYSHSVLCGLDNSYSKFFQLIKRNII